MRRIKAYIRISCTNRKSLPVDFDVVQGILTQEIMPLYSYDFGGSMYFTCVNGHHMLKFTNGRPYSLPFDLDGELMLLDAAQEQQCIRTTARCVVTPSFVLWKKTESDGDDYLFCRYCGRHNIYHTRITQEYHKKYTDHAAKCSRANKPYFTVTQLLCYILTFRSQIHPFFQRIHHNNLMKFMRRNARYTAWDMQIILR